MKYTTNTLVFFALCVEIVSCQTCPCSWCGNKSANCASANYKSVPGVFPPETLQIHMQINDIQRIRASDFGVLNKLLLLRLDQNQLIDVAPGTFTSMPSLDELVLSRNNLKSLPDDLFHPDAPLRRGIKIKNNSLSTFPLQLLKNTKKFINVENNPILCDCFAVIPPELKEKAIGTCKLPENLQGRPISTVTAEEVNCSICNNVECNNGSCSSEDGSTFHCKCFQGFFGENCLLTNLQNHLNTCNNSASCQSVAEKLMSQDVQLSIKTPEDVDDVAEMINRFVQFSNSSLEDREKTYPAVLRLTDLLLSLNGTLIAKAQMRYTSSKKVLKALDTMVNKIGCQLLLEEHQSNFSIAEKNIALSVIQPMNTSVFYVLAGKKSDMSYIFVSTVVDYNDTNLQSAMAVPESVLHMSENRYVSAINYQNNLFFLTEEEIAKFSNSNVEVLNSVHLDMVVHSNVFAVSVGNQTIEGLKDPVKLMFRNDSVEVNNNSCNFWNFSMGSKNSHGAWSHLGCKLTKRKSTNFVHCECDHLTNFALLVNADQKFYNPLALQVISYIGCGISIAALFLTLIVYIFFSKINRKLAPKLLVCLSTSLIILLVTFIVGAEATYNPSACQLVAVILHYFTLSTFCWTACEAFNLYRNFVDIFKPKRNENVILVRMSIFSWGVPLLVVAMGMGLGLKDYGDDKICVVQGYTFLLGLLLPTSLILTVNWVVLFLSLRGMRRPKILKQNRRKQEQQEHFLHFLRAMVCTTVLGLTWTFAILAIGELKVPFQWLFCIFNSLQGLLIFLLFVVNNREAKSEILKWIKGKRNNKASFSPEVSSIGKPENHSRF